MPLLKASRTASRVKAAWAATAASILAAGAASAAAGDELEELGRHRSLWDSAAVGAYEYGYQKYCDCHRDNPPETLVTVRDGEVVGVRHKPFGLDMVVEAEPRNFEYYWTVEGLFDLVASALGREALVRVDYDAARGYPTRIFIDYDADMIGDELDVRLTRLEPVAE